MATCVTLSKSSFHVDKVQEYIYVEGEIWVDLEILRLLWNLYEMNIPAWPVSESHESAFLSQLWITME